MINLKKVIHLRWFDGFDLVLLGDVHLRQIHKLVELTKNGIVNDKPNLPFY